MIAILNAGLGNIKSVKNSLNYLSVPNEIVSDLSSFETKFTKLILPGVGSFKTAMTESKIGKFYNKIMDIKSKKFPILGICLGSQILCTLGLEDGKTKGFGFIDGSVDKIDTNLRLPHIGWNNVSIKKNHLILNNIKNNFAAYFVHSYSMKILNENQVYATTSYEETFPSIVINENIIGMQFHPEKSQKNGLLLLKNFSEFNVS